MSDQRKNNSHDYKSRKDNEVMKEGYPVVVDAKDDKSDPVKGLPKAREYK